MNTNGIDSFGELLHTFRKRARVTQQRLAEAIGMHRHAISRWEQGEVLPGSKAIVLELARFLHLTNQESRQLLDASLTAPIPLWGVPFSPNPFFTGRRAVLQHLHQLLFERRGETTRRTCALSGLAGMGKTQTAIKYAEKHTLDYTAIFWANAETEESLLGSFAALARQLKLPVEYTQKQEDVVAQVLDWLTAHKDWLFIFDNVEEQALVQRFIPASNHGSCLFTTRLPTLGTLALCLPLQFLSLKESMQLLFHRTGTQRLSQPSAPISAEEAMAAREIATIMDGLPLALDQAASYIEEAQCQFTGFLSLLHHDTLHVLREHPSSAIYPHSVEQTFTLAFVRLSQQNRVAADILTLCCFLAPDEIPEALLLKGASHLTEELQAVLSDPFRLNATFKDLLTYALLRRNAQAGTFSIHRVVQVVLKEQLSEAIQRTWIERLIGLLDQLFSIDPGRLDTEHWAWCEQILPHAQSIVQMAECFQLEVQELGSLLTKIAHYLFQRARYAQAEMFHRRALAVQERISGADHPDVALTLAALARTHYYQENYQEIEPLYQRAIALLEVCGGPEDLRLAFPLQGLALFYLEMSRYEEAETYYQRAVDLSIQHLGHDHLDVATALSNFALYYYQRGVYAQAESFYVQALRIREQLLPPSHPDVGQTLRDLATLYYSRARYQEAEAFFLRSLSVLEQTVGSEHVEVVIALNNLASLYRDQMKYAVAESLYHRGLAINERIAGPQAAFSALLLNNLAKLYCSQEKYEEAETAATRALAFYEQSLASDHRNLVGPLQNLALVAYKRKQYAQAEAFSSRVFTILERTSPDHPRLAVTLYLQANLSWVQGRDEEAEPLYQHALYLYQKGGKSEHIDVALLEDDFAAFYLHLRRWEEAEQHYQEALRIWERYRELDHPAHIACLEHYAAYLERQQREREASEYRAQAQEMRVRQQIVSQAVL